MRASRLMLATCHEPRWMGKLSPDCYQSWRDGKARTIGSVMENKTMLDRVQITRLDDSIPRWQIRDLKVSTSELRYALRASEEQIQEAVNLKPGQQMTIEVHLGAA